MNIFTATQSPHARGPDAERLSHTGCGADFDTAADVAGASVAHPWLRIAGRSVIGLGGALYRAVTTEPGHAFKVEDATGQWFEGMADAVTPQMFGAIGDGVADDTAALQAALDHGGVIVLPRNSHYRVTAGLEITQSGTTLIGHGAKVESDTSANVHVFWIENKDDVVIEGVEIDGRKDLKAQPLAQNNRGVIAIWCRNLRVEGCNIHNCSTSAVRVTGTTASQPTFETRNIKILGCWLHDCGVGTQVNGTGAWIFGSVDDVVIANNVCSHNSGTGIGVDDVSSGGPQGLECLRIAITGNTVIASLEEEDHSPTATSAGVWIGGSRQFSVTGNVVIGYRKGMRVEASQAGNLTGYGAITGNYLEGGQVGLALNDCEHVSVSGNTIVSRTDYSETNIAVVVSSIGSASANHGDAIRIDGNTILSTHVGVGSQDGFSLPAYPSTRVTVANNDITYVGAAAAVPGDIGVTLFQVTDCIIQGNRVSGFYYGVNLPSISAQGTIIRDNTIHGSVSYGIALSRPARVLRNTVFDSGDNSLRVFSNANDSQTIIKDNEFLDNISVNGSTSSCFKVNNIGLT